MFVFTAKITKFKVAAGLIIFSLFLCAVIILIGSADRKHDASTLMADTEEKRVRYLESFGWEISSCTEERKILIPKNFTDVYENYNKIQLSQGFDLKDYAGLEAVQYTYEVLNYPDYSGTVYAEILCYNGLIIGGDVHCTEISGFMHGFDMPQ